MKFDINKTELLPMRFFVRIDKNNLNNGHRVYNFWRSNGKVAVFFDTTLTTKIVVPVNRIQIPGQKSNDPDLNKKQKEFYWLKLISLSGTIAFDKYGHLLYKKDEVTDWEDWGAFLQYEKGVKLNTEEPIDTELKLKQNKETGELF